MDFNKNLVHKHFIAKDALAAKRVLFHCFSASGKCEDRYFEPREVGGAFLLNRIEEKFSYLQQECPHYVSYTYTLYDAYDNRLTENFSNPLTPIRIGRKKFLENVKKRGGGIFFHDDPYTDQIGTFKI